MELNFTHGVREYTVHGVNGDAVIRFNPTDGEFVQRLYHAFEVLDKKQDAYNEEIRKCGDRVKIFEIARKRSDEMREIDFAVIPCVSCDREGHRLGQGGGFYDRFLAAYRGPAYLICRERLLRSEIPMEPHDAIIHWVVTEKTLYEDGIPDQMS